MENNIKKQIVRLFDLHDRKHDSNNEIYYYFIIKMLRNGFFTYDRNYSYKYAFQVEIFGEFFKIKMIESYRNDKGINHNYYYDITTNENLEMFLKCYDSMDDIIEKIKNK